MLFAGEKFRFIELNSNCDIRDWRVLLNPPWLEGRTDLRDSGHLVSALGRVTASAPRGLLRILTRRIILSVIKVEHEAPTRGQTGVLCAGPLQSPLHCRAWPLLGLVFCYVTCKYNASDTLILSKHPTQDNEICTYRPCPLLNLALTSE